MAFPIGENPVDRFHKSSHSRKPPPDLPPTPRDKTGFGRAWKPATTHPQTSPGLAPKTSGQNRVRSRMETGYHPSANLPRACPQHLRTKPGSVAHGNLFFSAAPRNLTIPEKFRGNPPTGNVRILLSKSAVPFQGPNPPISGCLPLNYL